ncbi:MAG: GNAT family N-acetyltransferase [Paracoccaceae bacterium]|nr:GNAT family N-acetyltransferase [Paracoccaceae bacterium]
MNLVWTERAAPTAEEYVALRELTGMGARDLAAARIGLRGSLHAVTVRDGGTLVGMGRIVGDGGCFAQVTDIAVDPAYQRRGIGREIVRRLNAWCDRELPATCYLSLIADPGAEALYASEGFAFATGMGRHIG